MPVPATNGDVLSVTAVVFNLVNLFVGSGVLSIPFAFACIGWTSGIFLFATVLLYWHCFSRLAAAVLHHRHERVNFAGV
jgi:amino acid permease